MTVVRLATLPLALAAAIAGAWAAPIPAGLSLAQFEQRQEGRMMAADADGDGRVSRAEFVSSHGGKGDPAARFAKIDANRDGFLDKAEIDAMLARRFHHLNRDGDGMLTAQERAAARDARKQQSPGQ